MYICRIVVIKVGYCGKAISCSHGGPALGVRGGMFLMITSMKSTHESIPFKHSVVVIYCSFMLNIVDSIGGVNMGNNSISPMITSMKSTHKCPIQTQCG